MTMKQKAIGTIHMSLGSLCVFLAAFCIYNAALVTTSAPAIEQMIYYIVLVPIIILGYDKITTGIDEIRAKETV